RRSVADPALWFFSSFCSGVLQRPSHLQSRAAMSTELTIETRSAAGGRAGRLLTPHGEVETPVFMPVGTAGTVKSVAQDVLEELGCQLVLANTYHLYLRPGHELIRQLGGLHRFISGERALLTDSGGYQVFSL